MESGPLVILTSSSTAGSVSPNTTNSNMTMGSSSSSSLGMVTQKSSVKTASSPPPPPDWLQFPSIQSIHTRDQSLMAARDAGHSASDAQLPRNHHGMLNAKNPSPAALSEPFHGTCTVSRPSLTYTGTELSPNIDRQSHCNTNHQTNNNPAAVSNPCDLSIDPTSLSPLTQVDSSFLPKSCPNSQTRLNVTVGITNMELRTSELTNCHESVLIAPSPPALDVDHVTEKSNCINTTYCRPNSTDSIDRPVKSIGLSQKRSNYPKSDGQISGIDNPQHTSTPSRTSEGRMSGTFAMFKIKRVNSGPKTHNNNNCSNRKNSNNRRFSEASDPPSASSCLANSIVHPSLANPSVANSVRVSTTHPFMEQEEPVPGDPTRQSGKSKNQHFLALSNSTEPPETNTTTAVGSIEVITPAGRDINGCEANQIDQRRQSDEVCNEKTSSIDTHQHVQEILNRRNLSTDSRSVVTLTTDPRSRTCCFCWCCCCSCSCTRVRASMQDSKRPSASNDPQARFSELNGDEKMDSEEIKSWGDSFDALMQCTAGRKLFREFLRSEYSEENIMFWLACEELKQESNPELIEEKARMIYEDFISILSPREVSLDSRVREIINANMIEPTPRTFDEAQLQIYTLMHRDSYLRFLNSRLYKDLLQQCRSRSISNSSLE